MSAIFKFMLYGNEAGCDGGGCNGVNGIFNTSLTPIVSQPKWPKQLNFWTHQLQRASEARCRSYWFVSCTEQLLKPSGWLVRPFVGRSVRLLVRPPL